VEHLWLTGLDIYDLMEGRLYHLMVGHLSLNGQGIYHLMGGGIMVWVGQL